MNYAVLCVPPKAHPSFIPLRSFPKRKPSPDKNATTNYG